MTEPPTLNGARHDLDSEPLGPKASRLRARAPKPHSAKCGLSQTGISGGVALSCT
jgi:hypothetical protein